MRWRLGLATLLAATAPPAVGQFIGHNFTARTSATSGFEPPDVAGAVGVNHFAQFLNGTTGIYNKDGTLVLGSSDTTFWNTTAGLGGGQLSPGGDSRVLYDAAAQRWVAIAFTTVQATNNFILLARTDGPSAVGPWRGTSFQTLGGTFADFPMLGMNGDSYQVTTNNFTSGGAGVDVSVFNLPKASLYAATPSTTNLTRLESVNPNTTGFSPHPVANYDPAVTGTTTLLSRFNGTNIRRVPLTGTGGAGAALGTGVFYTTTAVSNPLNAGQPGTTNLLDTGDIRHGSNPVQVGGRLFVTSTTASGSVSAIRYTVLNATNTTVLAQNTLTASGTFYSYPSVGVNGFGDVVIGLTVVLPGPPTFPGTTALPASAAVFVGTETGANVWTFPASPTLVRTGTGGYNGGRWGDYSSTTPDPADPRIFWTTQQYSNQTGAAGFNWATQATEVIVPNAGEARWQPSTAGNRPFADSTNWYGGAVPTGTQNVLFSRWTSVANSQSAAVTADTSVARLGVRQTGAGTLTLSLGSGTTFTATDPATATNAAGTAGPSLAVAEYQGQARLTVSGGGTLSTQTAIVAGVAGATGVLAVDGAGSAWTNAGGAFVGGTATAAGGLGTLSVTNGAAATVAGLLTVYNAPSASVLNTLNVGTAGAAATLTAGGLTNAGPGPTPPTVGLLNANSVLALTDSGSFSGAISGPGRVVKTASGAQTLSGANTYAGGTTLSGGTLGLGSPTAVGTGTLSIGTNVTLANATAAALTLTANNAQTWNGSFSTSGPALDLGTGPVSLTASPALTLTVGAGGLTVGGPIGGGGTGLIKAGAGPLTLTGTNSYTGLTRVNAGTLNLTGTGTLSASPSVTVAAGATLDASGLTGGASFGSAASKYAVPAGQTLSGDGTVAGGLSVASGGTLTSGSPLTVTAGSAGLLAGATASFRVTDASTPAPPSTGGSTLGTLPAPTSNAFLSVAGGGNNLSLDNGLTIVIDGTGTAFTAGAGYSYAVARVAGGAIPTAATGHTFVGVGFPFDPAAASLTTDGVTLYLNFTPVPEPGLILLVAAGGLWLRRRLG